MLTCILIGILAWTFIEYVFHRWLGHDRRFTKKNGFGREHVLHHADGNHFAPVWKKLVFVAGLAGLMLPLAVLALGLGQGLVLGTTVLGAYVVYEQIHRRMHVTSGRGRYARMLRRHHFFHHFHDPKTNFGVSSPLWDMLLGTWTPTRGMGRIVVPRKRIMPWLVTRDGAIDARFAGDYELR